MEYFGFWIADWDQSKIRNLKSKMDYPASGSDPRGARSDPGC
jgi:hypothetical protein